MKKINEIGFFEKNLTFWVLICMVIGIFIGNYFPFIPEWLGKFEFYNVSIPTTILLWIMIYPMMLKIDFKSIKDIGKNPKGLFITWFVNWIIKPLSMYLISSLFFFIIYKGFINKELASEYLAGAVLLGAAPCTAMVFVWSKLTRGDSAYTLVQVASNDLIILIAYIPIVSFLLKVGNINIPWGTLLLSIVRKKVNFVDVLTGSVAGLATITPAAGYVNMRSAIVIGLLAGIICNIALSFQEKKGWDDALGVWGVHGIGGFSGIILTGIFASKSVNGVSGSVHQFLVQTLAVIFIAVYSFILTVIILKVLGKCMDIKPLDKQVQEGLDSALLDENSYDMF